MVQNNPYHSAAFFTSSNHIVGRVHAFISGARYFIRLKKINEELAFENAALRKKISYLEKRPEKIDIDSAFNDFLSRYTYVPARVINATTGLSHNYITIDKGSTDSIQPGMGVVCAQGIVGKIKAVSDHYATITSVLHKEMMVSCRLKNARASGSLQWDGYNPGVAHLYYIPRHIHVQVGDTVVTSEYNSVFPDGVPVGTVQKIDMRGDESFYKLEVQLAVDFTNLHYVYVIHNTYKTELDNLEAPLKKKANR